MGAWPTLSCRIAFGSNPFDTTPIWTELGPGAAGSPGGFGWLRSFKVKRGRERLLRSQSQFQAGTATVRLDNRDRRFDPTNTSSPYWPFVQPEKLIQLGATWLGTFYPFWTGYVDDFPQVWPGMQEAEVPIVATDLFKSLAIKRLLSAGYQAAVLADAPFAYYRLNDLVGATSAVNAVNTPQPGDPNSAVTFGQTGAMPANVGTSASCAAATGTATGGTIALYAAGTTSGPSGMSIEFWVKFTGPGTGIDTIVASPDSTAPNYFEVALSGGHKAFFKIVNGMSVWLAIGATSIDDGNWHHVVARCGVAAGSSTRVSVDGVLDGTTAGHPAFWPLSYPDAVIGDLIVGGSNSDVVDVQEVALYNYELTDAQIAKHFKQGGFPAQYTGQFVNQILDIIGHPASQRRVDTGYTWCGRDNQDETQTKALDQLQKLEQTEQGQCYVASDGKLVFENRYRRFQVPDTVSVATFGDGGIAHPSEIPYAMGGVTLNFDRSELFNEVPVTRRGGSLQAAVNIASISQFTDRTMPGLSDLMMATDPDALGCAQFILADTAFPRFRVGDLILDPTADDRLWPLVLGLDIGQVVTVNKHNIPGGGSVSLICRVEGIEHEGEAPLSWKSIYHLSLTGMTPWFILDDPQFGILDFGNVYGW